MAFTKKQVEWFHRAYGHQCRFKVYTERRGWEYCGIQHGLQVHHIKPQRFYQVLFNQEVDYALNGILLCSDHHIGKYYRGELDYHNNMVPVVHPDTAWAYQHYHSSGKTSYSKMIARRNKILESDLESLIYEEYWNTDWDAMMQEVADEMINLYIIQHGVDDPFPKKRSRKRTIK